jgi:hypothetical protein
MEDYETPHLLVVITADEVTIYCIEDLTDEGTNEERVFTVESVDAWTTVDVTLSSPNVAGCMEDCSDVVEICAKLGDIVCGKILVLDN